MDEERIQWLLNQLNIINNGSTINGDAENTLLEELDELGYEAPKEF